jgi:hypothetical protein
MHAVCNVMDILLMHLLLFIITINLNNESKFKIM